MSEAVLFRPVTITYETLDRLVKEPKPADMIALYMSYVAITQWQQTTTVKATNLFMMKRLGWGEERLSRIRKRLIDLDLIEPIAKKDEDGRIVSHYTRVKYIITSESHTSQIPGHGENQDMVSEGTSASNLNISASDLKESAGRAVDFGGVAKEKTAAPPPAAALVARCIQIINPREKVTDDRIRVMNGRLKNYSEDEIFAAATEFSRSEWHKENNQMSIDNLIAPSKFGVWYAKSLATPLRDPRVYGLAT